MDSKIIQRYRKKSQPSLLKLAQKYFNEYIRLRDKGQKCISCNNDFQHAGHFYSAGSHSALRFNEDNVNGQCISCNYYKHGNLIEYRLNLENKIGTERLSKLDDLARINKRKSHKWDKITLIEIIETYKRKIKEL
jgi:hypothetical protein